MSETISYKTFSITNQDNTFYEVEVFDNDSFGFEDLKTLVSFQKEMGGLMLPTLVICSKGAFTNVEF